MNPNSVVFAHISDTHFGPERSFVRHGYAAAPCAERLVATLNELPFAIDFVVHTGDVATEPDDSAFRLAADTFAWLDRPIYFVTGNHDTSRQIRRFMTMGPHEMLSDDPDLFTYAFDVRGHRFLVVDARGPDEIDPQGRVSPSQMAVLDRELGPEGPPITVFCHFPPLPMDIPWIDETMLIQNGAEVHRRLAAAGSRLRGFFYGHVHQALTLHRDGVLYSAAPSAFAQLGGDPTDGVARVDMHATPGFAVVQVSATQAVVRPYAFARP